MSWISPASPSPLPVPTDLIGEEVEVHTDTACLALMDTVEAGEVWEDLLYDGHDHDHGAGGLMMNEASIGTHFEHDGDFPVRLYTDAEGKVRALEVNLDPYNDDLDSLRRPDEWTEEDEHDHGHDHEFEHHHPRPVDGWSEPVTVPLESGTAVFGNPAGLPQADDTGGLVDIAWPAEVGQVQATTYADGGFRRVLRVVWSA